MGSLKAESGMGIVAGDSSHLQQKIEQGKEDMEGVYRCGFC